MQLRCATCGAEDSGQTSVRAFAELGFGPAEDGSRLHLCTDCLDRRHAKRWAPGDEGTDRLRSELEGTPTHHPQGRYSYLRDPDQGVHLVRLQTDWARSHAQPQGHD
jgi:hypothetical protein